MELNEAGQRAGAGQAMGLSWPLRISGGWPHFWPRDALSPSPGAAGIHRLSLEGPWSQGQKGVT